MDINVVDRFIEAKSALFSSLADEIWQFAETGYQERNSVRKHIDQLKAAGFNVQEGVAGIPTAFIAEAGSGGPVIGILGEYDALSGLSQKSMSLRCEPSAEIANGNGHGCGHHLLGTSAHLAALAVKSFLEERELQGTVRFYGCPAEEGGWGKAFMARAGLFNDLSAALTWHPWMVNTIWNMETLAVKQVYFRFSGISAHAGDSPHLGRSALDALELLNIGINFLREHMLPSARIHYAITNAGGIAPNVVQANAEGLYMIRAPKNQDVESIYARVCDIARGAALMSGCGLEIKIHSGCSNLVLNNVLNQVMHDNLSRFGAPSYDEEERGFAESMHRTTRPEEIEMAGRTLQGAWKDPKPLFDGIDALDVKRPGQLHGSTDVGDVSWITPTAQCFIACYAFGTSPHSWQWVAQGKSSIAHKGMLLAAKTIAASALELFVNPGLLDQARQELDQRLRGHAYVCPIPDEVSPPIPEQVVET
ncbi:amidohydrolase [Burkholderia sp. SG-MS1]|uniref:M20 family metallopeptidase n=1 Tax=Paraburkholderia sp. SG-MS1 TaxID=2023741 RepID=UPI001446D4C7|nr:M20 family metallopeptidase [Paraburkholderia sp. SG-MS1]NKJ50673.1 amidohydrolase [Paraburkholderia sp. SG-MS1]